MLLPAVHICLIHRRTQAGLAEKSLEGLNSAVEWVKANPDKETEGVGRLYGMSANIPVNYFREYIHYQEPAWDTRRCNNINQHLITVYLGIHLKA
jgi:hypothetical protein